MKTKNFKLSEFTWSKTATMNGIDNAPPLEIMGNLKFTMEKMQEIRDEVGTVIDITSGYRCPKLNKLVNGAVDSDHLTGLGVDFRVAGYSMDKHKALLEKLLKNDSVRYGKVYKENRLHISFKR